MIRIEFVTCNSGKIFNDDTYLYFKNRIEGKDEIFYVEYMGKLIKEFHGLGELIKFCEKTLSSKSHIHALKSGIL